MHKPLSLAIVLLALAPLSPVFGADTWRSTRIESIDQTARAVGDRYPHRSYADTLIKRELDLQPSDTIIDIGAGDGWWTERFAKQITTGTIHALEVDQPKVDTLAKKFAKNKHVQPFLGEKDGTGLPQNSCDLAFFSQVYHHLPEGGHTAYLKHLSDVVKPNGRLVVIEKYTGVGLGRGEHGTQLSSLITQAENAGWVPMRIELMPKTYHFIAIFGQKEMFPIEPERKRNNTK
jgi:ubiquinone/menaquinone biosynthesis C-methylase UbiE